jgi:hypothetical protein
MQGIAIMVAAAFVPVKAKARKLIPLTVKFTEGNWWVVR